MNESRQQLRNRLELLEDIRCWLLDRIDGGEETKGDDGLISDFIRKLDALSSEMGAIGLEPRGCPTPGACSCPIPDVDAGTQLVRLTAELTDLKQRLLPQFQGRAERAERENADLRHDIERLTASLTAEVNKAPLSATGATDRPDWARQLPGAEIFDRAARYEYIRTLNPRKFSALYNEALMGVHQFDDLVDRYRMKWEQP